MWFIKEIRIYLQIFMGFFPSPLPLGMMEFDAFCTDIFDIYGLPDNPSYRHALASMIMHLGPTTASKSKWFFAQSVKKAMANQIAYQNIQLLKKLEQEYIEKTEATSKEAPIVQNEAV